MPAPVSVSASRSMGAAPPEPTVFVVDDDEGVRGGVSFLLRSAGLSVEAFPSADAFLAAYRPERTGCLVLDIHMPGTGGLELQERLLSQNVPLPVIFLTGHGDVPAAVKAMKGGAVDFLQKPFDSQVLLARVQQALRTDAELRRQAAERSTVAARMAQLTAREREIMQAVTAGKASKVIAIELNISERTVELHRSRIMKKMGARSVAELIHLAPEPNATGPDRGRKLRS